MTKKIIISTYDSLGNPHFGGGGAFAVHEVAKRLCDKFKVEVVTSKYPNSKNQKIDNVFYKRIGLSTRFLPQLSQFIYSICLPFYVLSENYDVWIESFTPPFSTGFLQLFTKRPVIGLVHMLAGDDMKRKYKLPFDLIEKIGLKTYRHFIVNTQEVKNTIKRINRKANIEIIGNGIDKVRKNNGKNDYALYIGRIEINQKGLDLLINSWKDVRKKLIIAGGNGQTVALKDLIEKNNLQSKINLVGQVFDKTKDDLFKNASFVVVPSRFETYSMSTLEAFSYGLPVVSFDIEGLKWTPSGATLKIHPFNIQSFASSCMNLFRQSLRRKQMGKIARQYAQKNTWDRVTKRYFAVVTKTL